MNINFTGVGGFYQFLRGWDERRSNKDKRDGAKEQRTLERVRAFFKGSAPVFVEGLDNEKRNTRYIGKAHKTLADMSIKLVRLLQANFVFKLSATIFLRIPPLKFPQK